MGDDLLDGNDDDVLEFHWEYPSENEVVSCIIDKELDKLFKTT